MLKMPLVYSAVSVAFLTSRSVWLSITAVIMSSFVHTVQFAVGIFRKL